MSFDTAEGNQLPYFQNEPHYQGTCRWKMKSLLNISPSEIMDILCLFLRYPAFMWIFNFQKNRLNGMIYWHIFHHRKNVFSERRGKPMALCTFHHHFYVKNTDLWVVHICVVRPQYFHSSTMVSKLFQFQLFTISEIFFTFLLN